MTPYFILMLTFISYLLNVLTSRRLNQLVKNSKVASASGNEIAELILGRYMRNNVKIREAETTGENLYDPIIHVIRLGPDVYGRKTLYSLAVGSHEASHALDFQNLRFLFIPVSFLGKYLFVPLFLLSFIIQSTFLHGLVLVMYLSLFLLKIFVEVVDEYRVNQRSIKILNKYQLLPADEIAEIKKLYRFFNFTYLASLPLKIILNR